MREKYEEDLDKAALHLKTLGDPDPAIRMRSVLAFTQCIGPYCPGEVASGMAQVMADAVAVRELWTKEDSKLQELVRCTMRRIRQNELAKVSNKQSDQAINEYMKELSLIHI